MIKPILLLLGLVSAEPTFAQRPFNAEISAHALSTTDGYRQRTKDERYEGLYALKVGAPPLEVVSVTHGAIDYELSDRNQLTLLAPRVPGHKEVGISGLSFGLNKNYRLDAVVGAGGKKVVPMREVLGPNYIYAQNLGLYGYLGEPQDPALYIPLRAVAAGGPNVAQAPIQVLLLPGATIEKLSWTYAKSTHGQCVDLDFRKAPDLKGRAMHPAHQPIVVVLEAADLKPGDEVCLAFQFRVLGDQAWRTKNMRLLVTE